MSYSVFPSTKQARRQLIDEIEINLVIPDEPTPVLKRALPLPDKKNRKIVIVTQDFTGLGWAVLAQNQGDNVVLAYKPKEDEEKMKEFNLVGTGLIKKLPLDQVIKSKEYQDAYFIFDSNNLSEYSERLRKEGRKVFGASALSARMEHDRKFGTDIAKQSGLTPPPTMEFHDAASGIEFLLKNHDKAYVFKPDNTDQSHLTFVPGAEKDDEANLELVKYLENLNEGTDSYVLQERKKGVETNFEVWFYKGKPFFAFCGLENKRKLNKDLGENVGCAQDIVFKISLNSKAIKETVGKMFPFYQKENYTGFADANVIIADNQLWFLEVCNRFGYNAHPNLFHSLALDSFAHIMADIMDGRIEGIEKRFRSGFGASLSLYVDHPRNGVPITIKPEEMKNFYPYDLYKKNDDLFLAGYDHQVGIVMHHDYTIEDAGESCFNKVYMTDGISFPDLAMRSDLHKTDYPSAPVKRYRALEAMKFI